MNENLRKAIYMLFSYIFPTVLKKKYTWLLSLSQRFSGIHVISLKRITGLVLSSWIWINLFINRCAIYKNPVSILWELLNLCNLCKFSWSYCNFNSNLNHLFISITPTNVMNILWNSVINDSKGSNPQQIL